MMATRAGSVDPGILLRLAADGVPVEELAEGLGHRAGSQPSPARPTSARSSVARRLVTTVARLAIDMFVRRAAAAIAAAATSLPRIDALVFTGGIGEHSHLIRAGIVGRLGRLGVSD